MSKKKDDLPPPPPPPPPYIEVDAHHAGHELAFAVHPATGRKMAGDELLTADLWPLHFAGWKFYAAKDAE